MSGVAFCGQFGFAAGEPVQSLQNSDGWKTLIPYQGIIDTDSIDGGSGVLTIPVSGIYQIKGVFDYKSGAVPPLWTSRIIANGSTVIAMGYNLNSTGTDYGAPIAEYVGCLEAGTTIEFQGRNTQAAASVVRGDIALLRLPAPFSQVELGYGDADAFIEWQPICDIPAWWDASDPTRITVPDTGYYLLSHKAEWQGTFTGTWWHVSRIYVNGVAVNENVGYPGEGSFDPHWNMPLSTVLHLTAGDYVEIFNDVQPGATPGVDLLTLADLIMCQLPGTVVGAHVYKSSQNAGVNANVTFNTSIFDTNSFWAGGTSAFLTVPSGKGGKYLVWGNDLKAGLRNVRSVLASVTAAATDPIDVVITGCDSSALAAFGSSPHWAIWELAVGEQIFMTIQNNDTPGNQLDLNMGMVLIDAWDYPLQNDGCPCPQGFIQQIYRWLKK